jgi:hypothetical protein
VLLGDGEAAGQGPELHQALLVAGRRLLDAFIDLRNVIFLGRTTVRGVSQTQLATS